MTNLNAIIQPERPTITAIVEKMRNSEYFVDNSFQRRLVWTTKQKIRLIETILMNYPMPEIYLWQQPADPESGKKKFSIVDGQQRMTSIVQFVSNEFQLKTSALDAGNRTKEFGGKFWKDLPNELKTLIWDYIVNIRQIPSEVSAETIRAVFRRLNETDRSLNPQELRHAEFSGEFVKAAENLADLPFWHEWEIFKPNQLRRMGDVDFCSSLLIYLRAGVTEDSTTAMNEIYDLYNDTYEEKSQDAAQATKALKRVDQLFKKSSDVRRLFGSVVHLYSLFVVLDRAKGKLEDQAIALGKFAQEYAKTNNKNLIVQRYRKGVSFRTRSKASRLDRVGALEDWLKLES